MGGTISKFDIQSEIPIQRVIMPENMNIDLQFIIKNPPNLLKSIIPQPQTNQKNISQVNLKLLEEISKVIIEYNKEWNFGNIPNTELPQHIMKEETYKAFLNFVTNLLQPNTYQLTQLIMSNNSDRKAYEGKKAIVQKINSKNFLPIVNKFFPVRLVQLFPGIPNINQDDSINVTLLGLAAIIGAEHLVIYFLMCGANPSITYSSGNVNENEDTATLMLSYQIALSNIQRVQPAQFSNYFIILPRILYNLYLLSSVGEGVNLSAIYKTNYKIKKGNQGDSPIQESILHQLVRIPYINYSNINFLKLTMKNGGSIPLLFTILLNNNRIVGYPKFWKNINAQGLPFGFTILYSLLMNNNIEGQIKLSLVDILITLGADPLIIPNLSQNKRLKSNLSNINEIDKLFTLLQTEGALIQILKKNNGFKQIYEEYMGMETQTSNQNIQKLISNNQKFKKIYQDLLEIQKKQIKSELMQIPNLLKNVQKGGKQIHMRTFHFLKYKKYSERAFIAERPIIAADNAYEFMKLHYNIGDKQVTFTLHDRVNNKKYKYIAKTLKDGTNVIKSSK